MACPILFRTWSFSSSLFRDIAVMDQVAWGRHHLNSMICTEQLVILFMCRVFYLPKRPNIDGQSTILRGTSLKIYKFNSFLFPNC